ncbi:uncharacterized protein LOC116567794 [Mustela erminea]|uniref:uncharacterized protein LOC116567794 n=1 Tax=Mustela erminea TaxID=36723 RepID=UPI001386EDA9|nr:uncharacterized protein LOC116567794 [Mustela erminea]XP_032159005.1 uncharacterized protein LOC116567794 [Mustela erminea]XP_032159006.1 uncharacterized protein LOC116567794 [Mustela erminea]XP_032159008.1 uncharacterized protein LOC116567794 [Mustela erminea]
MFRLSAGHTLPPNSGIPLSLRCLPGSQAPFNPGPPARPNYSRFSKALPPKQASCPMGLATPPPHRPPLLTLHPSLKCVSKHYWSGAPGWLSGLKPLPSAWVIIPGSWDQALHRAGPWWLPPVVWNCAQDTSAGKDAGLRDPACLSEGSSQAQEGGLWLPSTCGVPGGGPSAGSQWASTLWKERSGKCRCSLLPAKHRKYGGGCPGCSSATRGLPAPLFVPGERSPPLPPTLPHTPPPPGRGTQPLLNEGASGRGWWVTGSQGQAPGDSAADKTEPDPKEGLTLQGPQRLESSRNVVGVTGRLS